MLLATDIESKISGIVSKIVKFYKPELIILFGSFANNNYTKDSDLDLLVVKNTRKHPLWRRVEVRKIIQTDIPVDIVVFTPSEFARLRKSGSAFIEEILKEGKILYQREIQVLV